MSEHAVILNVDDDEAGRFAVTHILRRAGFEVHEAGTGEEGLRLARAVQPDLMLLDIVLPDIDGFEVCRLLKGDPATSGISIIHLSAGRTAGHDKAVGLEGGADAYLTEPVGEEELVATVRTFLRIRRAEAGQRLMADRFRSALEAAELGTFDHDLVSGERNWDQRLRALLGL
ncbi:MAG TPA: response regulator, partial [Myxococcota bacterium]|nr:response regulator [Myxococcota bacterium]